MAMNRYDPVVFDEKSKDKYEMFKREYQNLFAEIDSHCLPSREISLAMTKLDESIMWLNRAIRSQQLKRYGVE